MEIKDKPDSMSAREWITKKASISTMIPENIVRQVISHQFDSAYEALENNNSIEISGFGKFYYNTKKAIKELENTIVQKATWQERYDREDATEKERRKAEEQLKWYSEKLLWLKNKSDDEQS